MPSGSVITVLKLCTAERQDLLCRLFAINYIDIEIDSVLADLGFGDALEEEPYAGSEVTKVQVLAVRHSRLKTKQCAPEVPGR